MDAAHSEIPLLGVPIESISHIEVIRGPGAVYYGSNASAGVINVVTKKSEGDVIALSVGSNGLANASTYQHYQLDEDVSLSFALEALRDEGFNGEFMNVPKQPSLNVTVLKLTYKKLPTTISFLLMPHTTTRAIKKNSMTRLPILCLDIRYRSEVYTMLISTIRQGERYVRAAKEIERQKFTS